MLLNKKIASGDIVTIKLIGGEELIARYDSEDEKYLRVSKPRAVTATQSGLGLIPWIFLGEIEKTPVEIKQSTVVTVVLSKPDASSQFIEGTTGIAMPGR